MKKTAFASATDTRACTACTCDSPAGASCSARVATTNTDLACASGPKSLSILQLCANLGTVKSANVSAASVTGGACAASKSVAAGAATPTSPTTICCTM